jgi:hypothetical protein
MSKSLNRQSCVSAIRESPANVFGDYLGGPGVLIGLADVRTVIDVTLKVSALALELQSSS